MRSGSRLALGVVWLAPAAFVVALWLASGVSVSDVALFAGYQVFYVIGPGWLVYRWLSREPGGPLRQLALGWTVGLAIAIAVGPLGVVAGRWLALYPLVFLVATPLLRNVDPRALRLRGNPAQAGAIGAAVVLGVGLIAAWLLPATPLPGTTTVTYSWDMSWHVAMSAEALHHWPVSDPQVAGVAMPYHVFAYFQIATAAHVTGVPLAILVFRLVPLALAALLCLLVVVAASSFTRGRFVGPLAVAFLFLPGELDLDPNTRFPFIGSFVYDSAFSPSVQLGLVFTLATFVVARDALAADRPTPRDWRPWLLFAMLAAAAVGTKVLSGATIVGGLLAYAAWNAVSKSRTARPALAASALATAISLVLYLAFFRGGSGGTTFDPPGAIRDMAAVSGGLRPSGALWIAAIAVGLVGRFGGLVPGVVSLTRARATLRNEQRLLISAFVVALGPFLALRVSGLGEEDYVDQALFAGALLAAEGAVLLWRSWVAPVAGAARWLVLGAVVWLAALCALALQNDTGFAKPYTALGRAFGAQRIGWSYAFYPAVAVGFLLCAVLIVRRRSPAHARVLAFAAVTAVVLVASLDQPLDLLPNDVHYLRHDQPLYDQSGHTLTPALYRGLVWVRRNTDRNDVLAVNNHDTGGHDGAFFGYAAFAERRIFLGGWTYSTRAFIVGEQAVEEGKINPFPQRLRLNDAVFQRGDRRALGELVRDYGVRYLLVDRANGPASPRVAGLGRLVFSNSALSVYSVGGSRATSS